MYHVPGDQSVTAHNYIAHQSYDLNSVKREQREGKFRKIHAENQMVLERIMSQKPSVNMDEIRKWSKKQREIKRNMSN
jgi:hypothetical protein